jgi:hypothetical protein
MIGSFLLILHLYTNLQFRAIKIDTENEVKCYLLTNNRSFEYEKVTIYGFDENELCRNYVETMTTLIRIGNLFSLHFN